MASLSFGSALRSFWHTMTSYDRRRHVPLQNGRNSILTGVATASESRADVSYPYSDETSRGSPPRANGTASPGPGPYSPGMRSLIAKQADGFEPQNTTSTTDVQMQSFKDGLPPPPPVRHSWKRIDAWAEEHYQELWDQLGEGATDNDLNDLEHQLDCSLPQDVRESLMIHDGQERGGNPTGIIFGSMLMDCEEIVQEWETWRRVNHQFLLDTADPKPTTPSKAFGGNYQAAANSYPSSSSPASSSSSSKPHLSSAAAAAVNSDGWRQDLMARQDSLPPNAVQKSYAHVGWIPLVRDWGGNNLAVDLTPGPAGRWGQVILFGRDYDTKYVVARSWAAFLALVADDLNSGKWFVDDETGELKLREFKDTRVEPPYFSILRWRMDQKHGKRAAQRASMVVAAGPKPHAPSPRGAHGVSPYAQVSPVERSGDARGRSLQRLGKSSPLGSPMRPSFGRATPLGSVSEESSQVEAQQAQPQPRSRTQTPTQTRSAMQGPGVQARPSRLVELATPRASEDVRDALHMASLPSSEPTLLKDEDYVQASHDLFGKQPVIVDESMRTIEI